MSIHNNLYTLYIDGSHYQEFDISAGGGILYFNKKEIAKFQKITPKDIDDNFHEYFALSTCLNEIKQQQLTQQIDIKTDCLPLAENIKKIQQNISLSSNIYTIIDKLGLIEILSYFTDLKIEYIPRNENHLADNHIKSFITSFIQNNNLEKTQKFEQPLNNYINQKTTLSGKKNKNINNNHLVIFIEAPIDNSLTFEFNLINNKNSFDIIQSNTYTVSSKNWGTHITKTLTHFLSNLNIEQLQISSIGYLETKLYNYIRPNSILLEQTIKNELDKTYSNYEQILFYKNDDIVNQFKLLKNLPNKQNKEIIQENKNNKKSFLLLALKSIYDENSKNQFLSDNINHEHIQSVPKEKLSIEEIQKNLFEQFLGDKLENNIRKATALRQNLEEKNNIKLKF